MNILYKFIHKDHNTVFYNLWDTKNTYHSEKRCTLLDIHKPNLLDHTSYTCLDWIIRNKTCTYFLSMRMILIISYF